MLCWQLYLLASSSKIYSRHQDLRKLPSPLVPSVFFKRKLYPGFLMAALTTTLDSLLTGGSASHLGLRTPNSDPCAAVVAVPVLKFEAV